MMIVVVTKNWKHFLPRKNGSRSSIEIQSEKYLPYVRSSFVRQSNWVNEIKAQSMVKMLETDDMTSWTKKQKNRPRPDVIFFLYATI